MGEPTMMYYFAEFIGCFLFVGAGYAYMASVNLKGTLVNKFEFLPCFLVWGIGLGSGVSVAIKLGSPACLNPAVALGKCLIGAISVQQMLGLWLAEFLGAGFSVALVMIFFWDNFKMSPDVPKAGFFSAKATTVHLPMNFVQEIIASATFTSLLFIGLLNASVTTGLGMLDVTMTGLLSLLWVGFSYSATGFSMNPMRSFFSSIWFTILPIPEKHDKVDWKYQIIVNMFGSTIGCIIAVLIEAWVKKQLGM